MPKKKTTKASPCGSPKDWEAWGKEWEAWGEDFGRKMEAKFAHGPPWHKQKKELSVFGLVFSLLILAWGLVWLGNEVGWWQYDFPFWPILVILIGLGALVSTVKNAI